MESATNAPIYHTRVRLGDRAPLQQWLSARRDIMRADPRRISAAVMR